MDLAKLVGNKSLGYRMEQKSWKKYLFGKEIYVEATILDNGATVFVTGGDSSHIGAISVAETGNGSGDAEEQMQETCLTAEGKSRVLCQTIEFPGHKEAVISEKWAKELAGKWKCRVIVQAGIHYDNVTKEQIRQIVVMTDEMLKEVVKWK